MGHKEALKGSGSFPEDQARKRHININFLVRLLLGHPPGMSPGQTGFVPGTKWVCPRDKPRFSSYFTQRKPSLSRGQTGDEGRQTEFTC